jgi:uncharacterized RDD family membrane protein YckC
VSRLLAATLDFAATIGAVLLGYLAIGGISFVVHPRSFRWPDPGASTLALVWWLVLVAYLTFGWTASGRTLGMQVMGLRVVNLAGGPLNGVRGFARAVLCATFPVGLLWCAINPRRLALHDLLVRSSVVYDWIPRSPGTPRHEPAGIADRDRLAGSVDDPPLDPPTP